MEKEVIILTKSDKNGGYCVAGIDKGNGKFIRLVSEDCESHFALHNNDLIYEDEQSYVEVMDVVKVRLKCKQNCIEQPENYIIDDGYYMKKIGVSNRSEISQYLMKQDYIFYNSSNLIESENLEKELQKYSLVMFKVDELNLWKDKYKERITANFTHEGNEYRFIKITDSSLTEKYYQRVIESSPRPLKLYNPILIMSLTPKHQDGRHYKLVANIIEEEITYWGENPFSF